VIKIEIQQAAKPAGLRSRQDETSRKSTCIINFNLFRPFILAALGAGTFIASTSNCFAQNAEQAASSQALVNMAGVVTHLTYTDTSYYQNWPQVFTALQDLGVHHIRDGFFNPDQFPMLVQEHQQLLGAGIKSTYVIPWDTSITPDAIEQMAYATGDVDAIEGPNECDVLGQCGGGGAFGIGNAVAFLPTLQAAAQDLNVPLVAPSWVLPESYPVAGNLDSLINLNSMHLYFGGRNPGSSGWGDFDPQGNSFGSFNYWYDQSAVDAPGLPSQIGETGYISFPSTNTPYTVPESVTASYIPRTLLLAFKHGYDKTFFYQLIDDPTSPQGYGLLRPDFSEKPGFTALKNLLSLLSDPNPGASFTPGSLPFQILGGDSNVNHLLLQKSDGSYWLALWLEEPSWDPANVTPIQVQPENIGILLGNGYTTTTDYQFNTSGNYVTFDQPMNGNIAGLTVTDQVSVIRIVPQ
jgi:hypothetical protein